ncbi:helix-turn-helix domain-containing protein [Streptomyces sp. NPDC055990]|uniref:helix-turn-helix domain-containing protein n=1 Tax=Streptomyces sp. NPDC055990 TaxID=3345672 RepID=UPI0035D539EB
MHESDSVGKRINKYRKMRGMTQAQLATAADVGRSMLATVESGSVIPSSAWVGSVARALRVDASRLYADDDIEQTLDIVPILRRTLAATDLMDDGIEPLPLGELRAEVARVGDWRRGTKYRKIAEVLPDLVDQLLVSGQEVGEPAYALLTDAYRAANTLSHKMGYSDLSLTATERMQWAATKSGDPLLLATVHYVKAATLSRIGAGKQALRLLTRAMSDIEDLIGKDRTAAAVYSTLHMRAGTISATLGDTDASRSHLDEASQLAASFGEGVVYDTVVGPTNVRLYKICAEVDLGNPEKAVEISQGTRIPRGMATERQTYFWLDSARAHLLNGDPDSAIDALAESRSVSTEHFRSSPTVKAAIHAVAEQQRRASDALRSLANSAGIAD